MERTISITIASRAFTLAESAYDKLQQYIESLKTHFLGNPDHDEIMRDIESRIAELLEPHAGAISLSVVESVIANIGTIADFEIEDGKEEVQPENEKKDIIAKKFYRNPDDVLIAGVCSGLGAYFGVDATWMRLAFVVMTFMSGFGILFYLLLWFITPEAKTKAQKLEMAGSPVTLETLSESVLEKADEVTRKSGGSIRRAIAIPFRFIGGIIQFLMRGIPTVIRIFLGIGLFFAGIGGLVLIMILSGFLLSGDARIGQDVPLTTILPGMLLYSTLLALTLAVLVPALLTFIGGFSLLRKKNAISATVGFLCLGAWLLALMVSGFGLAKGIHNYAAVLEKADITQTVSKDIPLQGTFTMIDVRDGLDLTLVDGASTTLTYAGPVFDTDTIITRIEKDTLIIEEREEKIRSDRFCLFCSHPDRERTLTLTLPSSEIVAISARNRSTVSGEDMLSSKSDLRIDIKNGSRVSLRGEVRNLTVDIDSNSSADISFSADSVVASITNGSDLSLKGKGRIFEVTLNQGSSLDADDFRVASVTAEASNGSSGSVYATKTLHVKSTHGSSVTYGGEPESMTKEADEGSSVEKG